MQDQDFNKDQNLENRENQETVNASPENETVRNFSSDANETEQETIVFSRPVEIPVETQNVSPGENILQKTSSDEEELFDHYEIKSWSWTPRIYKIFAFSAIFNILFIVAVAQTNILRAKACDSPLVGGFCQVLDTLYVGGKVLSTDAEWGSKDYEQSKISDADVVWLDKTGIMEQPLNYPAGYFQIANPEQFLPEQNGMIPGMNDFPTAVTTSPAMPNPTTINPTINPTMPRNNGGAFTKPAKLPKVKGNEITGDFPTIGDMIPGDATNDATKKPNTNTTAENKKPEEKPKQSGLDTLPFADEIINKKPLQDFSNVVLDKVAKKEVDLNKEFAITMVGTITDEGKFDPKKSAFLKSSGDQAMVDVAKLAIEAVGDSGLLTYLKRLDVNQIKFDLVQNEQGISVVIISDQKSENSAKKVSSGLNTAISLGKMTVKEEDTLALLNAAKIESKEKSFILNFNLEKEIAQQLIKRQLEKAEAKRKQAEETKPNSTAQTAKTLENTAK